MPLAEFGKCRMDNEKSGIVIEGTILAWPMAIVERLEPLRKSVRIPPKFSYSFFLCFAYVSTW
jgi:hypothetical protein